MLRTQIYLPRDLREKIDKERAGSGESLADYLRKAAEERVERQRKKKADLKRLADTIFSKPKLDRKRADDWVKQIREDRKREDKRIEEMWDRARER